MPKKDKRSETQKHKDMLNKHLDKMKQDGTDNSGVYYRKYYRRIREEKGGR